MVMGFWKEWRKVCVKAMENPEAPGIVWGKEEKLFKEYLDNKKNKNLITDAEWRQLENKSRKGGKGL